MHYEQLNPDECMSYLLVNDESKKCIIIDAKLDFVDFYMNLLNEKNVELVMVIDTHTHADHLSGAALLSEKTGCRYLMHENTEVSCVTDMVRGGEHLDIHGIEIDIVHTPGHSKDSICVVFEDKIFTGDFIFLDYGGGRNDLPSGNIDEHWESLRKIKKLPEYLIVCPGHNYSNASPSTLWLQKKKNPYFKIKDRKGFKRLLSENKPDDPSPWMFDVVEGNKKCIKDSEGIEIPHMDSVCQSGLKRNRSGFLIITPDQLRDKMKGKDKPMILDVRSQKEIDKGKKMIEGSLNIPLGGLGSNMDTLKKYKDKEIVIVCRSGFKSRTAAKILIKSGFKRVYVLQGGINDYNT